MIGSICRNLQPVWKTADCAELPALPKRSVYTTLKWPCNHLDWHYSRLTQDAVWLGLAAMPFTLAWVQQYLAQLPLDRPWRVRITLLADGWEIRAQPVLVKPEPARVMTVDYQRTWPLVKHGDLDACHQLTQHAINAGFTDAVLLTPQGLMAEGAFAGLAVWDGQQWMFPHPLCHGVLPSITARRFQQALNQYGIPWHYQAVRPDQAQGMVLLSAIRGVLPVSHLNNRRLKTLPLAALPEFD